MSATGPFSNLLQLLEWQLIDCTDFTDEVTGVDAAGWAEAVHWNINEDFYQDNMPDRPFAVISHEQFSMAQEGVAGTCQSLTVEGGLMLVLERDAGSGSMKASYLDFMNWVGEIVSHIQSTNGVAATESDGTSISWKKVEVVIPAQRVDVRSRDSDENDYWLIAFMLSYE